MAPILQHAPSPHPSDLSSQPSHDPIESTRFWVNGVEVTPKTPDQLLRVIDQLRQRVA